MTAATGTANRRTRWWSSSSARHDFLWALVFLSPWIIGFLVFTAGPMIWSLALSFTNYNPLRGDPTFTGLANYQRLLTDSQARLALNNTVFFTVLFVPLHVLVALGLALMLNRVGRASGVFRTIFYVPNVTPAVAIGHSSC